MAASGGAALPVSKISSPLLHISSSSSSSSRSTESMSCGGNCNCGSNCSCGGGCKMYPGLEEKVTAATETVILGVAPAKSGVEGVEITAGTGAENGGCKCGSGCNCDPCNC